MQQDVVFRALDRSLPDENSLVDGCRPRRLRRHRGHVVARDVAVSGDHDEALELGLGDQHPIERVAVVRRKGARLFRVTEGKGEWREALFFDACFEVVRGLQLPQHVLDCDLLGTDRTDEDFASRVLDDFTSTLA